MKWLKTYKIFENSDWFEDRLKNRIEPTFSDKDFRDILLPFTDDLITCEVRFEEINDKREFVQCLYDYKYEITIYAVRAYDGDYQFELNQEMLDSLNLLVDELKKNENCQYIAHVKFINRPRKIDEGKYSTQRVKIQEDGLYPFGPSYSSDNQFIEKFKVGDKVSKIKIDLVATATIKGA